MPVRALYSDIDDTLIMWESNEFFNESRSFEIEFMGTKRKFSPNDSNINKLKEFYKKGYEIVAWSASGKEWSTLIVEQLGLKDIVDYCLSKPDFYIDDLDITQFMLPEQRIWLKPSGSQN